MKWKYLYIWLIGLLAIGCFDDDTTVDTVRISEIAIDTNSLQKEYNRDKNQTLVIDITPYDPEGKSPSVDVPVGHGLQVLFGFVRPVRGLSGFGNLPDAGESE